MRTPTYHLYVGASPESRTAPGRGRNRYPLVRVMVSDDSSVSKNGMHAARQLLEWGSAAGADIGDPLTGEFASALLRELGPGLARRYEGFAKDYADGMGRLARGLNVEREHGLIEVIQNADDLGAHTVRFALDPGPPRRLLVAHDGDRVLAQNVYAMTVGLVSTKRDDAIAIGKFGIGLQTLRRLAAEFEVHCPPYHFRIAGVRLEEAEQQNGYGQIWDQGHPDTLFILELREDYPDDGIVEWFGQLRADDMLFLRSVCRLELTSPRGEVLERHELIAQEGREVELELRGERIGACEQVLVDPAAECKWTRLKIERPVPAELQRSDKATLASTQLAIAYADPHTQGRLFAGLPLAVGGNLPFCFNAPFDTDTPRTEIVGEPWNEWVLDEMVELAAAVAVQRFAEKPNSGWGAVPCAGEMRGVADKWLRDRMGSAVKEIQSRVKHRALLPGRDGSAPLSSFVAEVPELEDALQERDLRALAGERELLVRSLRDPAERWRRVMRELMPDAELSVGDALAVLEWPDSRIGSRPGEFFVRLAYCAIETEQQDLLSAARFVLLADGRRISPATAKEEGLVLTVGFEDRSLGHLAGAGALRR